MAFYYNRFSDKSIANQWGEYYQNHAYVNDINGVLNQNRQELEATIKSASSDQAKVIQQVCGSIDEGFSEMSRHLQDINFNISELRGEINEMAAMLDWRMSQMIEAQKITNLLLGKIEKLLRLPDKLKEKVYYIEEGLKYLKNAFIEGIDSGSYEKAFKNFSEANQKGNEDYITLNRIGQVYLYSKKYLNFQLAKEYFLKSASEAMAEANAGGTSASNNLIPEGQQTIIYSENRFKAAAVEAYLYASRACYLEQNLSEATDLAGKAYNLISAFVEAGFEQAKYLAANNKEDEAAKILEEVINKDRYFSIKTLSDQDLNSKPAILYLLETLHTKTILEVKNQLKNVRMYFNREVLLHK